MHPRAALWLWAALLVALLGTWSGLAWGAEVIPPGREATVLALVQRALGREHETVKFDVRIEGDTIRVQIHEPEAVDLLLRYEASSDSELAPGVQLQCGDSPCSGSQRARWGPLAQALASERDTARDQVWSHVEPAFDEPEDTPQARLLWALVSLLGLGWLCFYAIRCLAAMNWRERRVEVWLSIALCSTSAIVALTLSPQLPAHEHNSYLARADCAWALDCVRDPAGPGWTPAFFRVYGPLLHAFPYSVVNLCRFTLMMALIGALLARHWLERSLSRAGWSTVDARRAGAWGLALVCLNPVWIRVAAAGTGWPYVVVCLFGAGIATQEALVGSKTKRLAAGTAATCLLALAANSNLVMLTALPLLWLGPAMSRGGRHWWLPSPWQVAAAAACAALSLEALDSFRAAIRGGADTHTTLALRHIFFDYRFLPPTLGVLLLIGVALALRRRSPLFALVYVAAAIHPTLTSYAGPLLGLNYPVSLINAFMGQTLGGLLAGVFAAWGIRLAHAAGRARFASSVIGLALLLPLPFANESWRFLRGGRVAERELRAISAALPNLPPHAQLVIPSRIQAMPAGVQPEGDPIELRFPVGEYVASQRRLGRNPALPLQLDALARSDTPKLGQPGMLLYVGASQRSFFRTESEARVVPADLRRQELAEVLERFELVPVSTFELTPEQHPAIPWRLGAGRAAKVELGFYWLEPRER